MEDQYWTECEVCGVETEVYIEGDDLPTFCPMCGEETEWTLLED